MSMSSGHAYMIVVIIYCYIIGADGRMDLKRSCRRTQPSVPSYLRLRCLISHPNDFECLITDLGFINLLLLLLNETFLNSVCIRAKSVCGGL